MSLRSAYRHNYYPPETDDRPRGRSRDPKVHDSGAPYGTVRCPYCGQIVNAQTYYDGFHNCRRDRD